MKTRFVTIAYMLLFPLTLLSQRTVIKNVNLIDVKTGKVVRGSTVVIAGERIEEVGPSSKIRSTTTDQVIDGTNKFLMPGLVDSHIHFFQSGGLYTRPDVVNFGAKMPYAKERQTGFENTTDYLKRYLRLGITTVIDVGGPFNNFLIRDSISKTIISPNVLVTGPLFSIVDRKELELNDPPIVKISSLKQADSLFQKMLLYKPDFIKIWYIANTDNPAEKSFPLVKHIAQQTHKNGLKLTIHATELNTAKLAVEAGADILVHSVDDEIIPDEFIKSLKEKKVTYIPTLQVASNYFKVFAGKLDHHEQDLYWANAIAYGSVSDLEAMDDMEMPEILRMFWKKGIPAWAVKLDSISSVNVKKLVQAGVQVATGTDAGNIGTFHASSYYQELEAMQKAGLSSVEIIKASTINAATGFDKGSLIGSIEKGKLADLILLSKNPLEDIQHLNAIELVFKSGSKLLPDSIVRETPEAIVQRQVNAYNARNIDAFLATYSDDVEIYDYNGKLLMKGHEQMRGSYSGFFTQTPNLYCEIVKRMVMGNKIIDQEKVRANKEFIYGVAVYEVSRGKIKKVTFIQ
jgi:imidazolonepropionase-like amidohydrolase